MSDSKVVNRLFVSDLTWILEFTNLDNIRISYGINLYNSSYTLHLSISKDIYFGNGFRISLSEKNPKKGHYKGFDGIQNEKIRNDLKFIHERCMSYFGFKDCIVGSSYVHSGGFSIKYFTEIPNYEFEEKSIDVNNLYGEYYVRELPLLNGYIVCSIRSHSNMFDFYKNTDQIDGIFALWGGSGPSRYYNPLSITSGKDCDKYGKCIPNSPIEQWVTDVWTRVARKYGIHKSTTNHWNMTRSRKDGDISTIEFMDILVENQESFKDYKQLPKVNKDR